MNHEIGSLFLKKISFERKGKKCSIMLIMIKDMLIVYINIGICFI